MNTDAEPFTLTLLDTTDYASLFTWFCGKCHLPSTVHKHNGAPHLPAGWEMGAVRGRPRPMCPECADDHFDVEAYRDAWMKRRDDARRLLLERARRDA